MNQNDHISDDEIDLLDLFAVMIKRRYLILIASVCIIAVASVYLFIFQGDSTKYLTRTTLNISFISADEALIQKTNHQKIVHSLINSPSLIEKISQDQTVQDIYTTQISQSQNLVNYISSHLSSETITKTTMTEICFTDSEGRIGYAVLNSVIENLSSEIEDYNMTIYESSLKDLDIKLNSLEENFDMENATISTAYQELINKKVSEERGLSFTVIDYPQESPQKSSRDNKKYLIISVMGAIFLAIFLAFFMEFMENLKSDAQRIERFKSQIKRD